MDLRGLSTQQCTGTPTTAYRCCHYRPACAGHSGFNVPWSPFRFLPLQGTTGDHDAHHSLVKGNCEWQRTPRTGAAHATGHMHAAA